jgi:TPR repeat protein
VIAAPAATPPVEEKDANGQPIRYTPEARIIKESRDAAAKEEQRKAEIVAAGEPPEIAELKAKAEKNDAEAQHRLGVIYAEGEGSVERNYDEAFKWHRLAALNANAESQHYLGFCYENGIGVTRNNVEAAEWYLKAATQGNAQSQGVIGNMYHTGTGVEQSDGAAYFWVAVAKKNGDTYYESLLEELKKKIAGKHLKSFNRMVQEWKPSDGEKTLNIDDFKLE